MSKGLNSEVDGNVHFLNQHLDEVERSESGQGVAVRDKDIFSGEELYDLLGDVGFKEGLEILREKEVQYPEADFGDGAEVVLGFEDNKKRYSVDEYIHSLARHTYETVKYWFDTKWLALNGEEDDILGRVLEFLSDIIYEEEELSVQDFVQTITVGRELLEILHTQSEKSRKTTLAILRACRLKELQKGLTESGITLEHVLYNTPVTVADALISNTKMGGRKQVKYQVSPELHVAGLETLGIPTTAGGGTGNEEEAGRLYANVYSAFKQPSHSKAFRDVVSRVNQEVTKRLENGEELRFINQYYKDAGLVIYSTKKAFLIVGTDVTVHQRLDSDKQSLVFRKSIHDILVRDIKALVGNI